MPGTVKAKGERAGKALSMAEKAVIIQALNEGKDPSKIAEVLGRNVSTVQKFRASMVDTTGLAKAIFRSSAASLADRVVKKASVREALDVLSRPDIGVIAPALTSNSGGNSSFGVSVAVSTLGTVVQVTGGAANASKQQLQVGPTSDPASEGRILPESGTINIPPEQVEVGVS